ncbi:MAG: hypothetical protein ACK526_14545 [Planctomyces sp.]
MLPRSAGTATGFDPAPLVGRTPLDFGPPDAGRRVGDGRVGGFRAPRGVTVFSAPRSPASASFALNAFPRGTSPPDESCVRDADLVRDAGCVRDADCVRAEEVASRGFAGLRLLED